jgi:hypothetical protein
MWGTIYVRDVLVYCVLINVCIQGDEFNSGGDHGAQDAVASPQVTTPPSLSVMPVIRGIVACLQLTKADDHGHRFS